MIATNDKTITYTCNGYLIDIVTKKDSFEAWIYTEEACTKHLMFGMPKDQQGYFEFFQIVEDNVGDFVHLCDD